ncbi:MAG TPA: ATP-binding protein, partial [Opitutales bacterium]|nr:ATP-binding protein [Opitutales bacterium]
CKIHSTWISEMLLNLVLNAGDATSNAGEILVKVYRSGDFAIIEVHDNGRGIQPKDRERIFEPFFTTKREGSGLGLMTVKACVDRHNGFLQIGTSHLGGALFSIWLPAKARKVDVIPEEPQIWGALGDNVESFAAVGS